MLQLLLLLALSLCLQAQTLNPLIRLPSDPALTSDQRLQLLWRNNFASTNAATRTIFPAFFAHLSDRPREWDRDGRGFAQRLGTAFAIQTTRGVVSSGVSAAFGADPRYQRCDCQGAWRRVGNALSSIVVSGDGSGGRRFDGGPLASAFSAGYVGASLYPDNYRVSVKGYQLGGQLAMATIGQNLFQEFSPEIKRFFRTKILRR
jgi:hypothetical protein